MPVPQVIRNAADNFRFNSDSLLKMTADLSPEEWLQRPGETSNHIAWIAGHMIWTRLMLLRRLGTEWAQPWLGSFTRGTKIQDPSQYPSKETLLAAWTEVSGILSDALENASEEVLAQPASQGPPSPDGKVSGVVCFLAIHETYHLGQVSYLRGWLGHKGLMG